MCEAWPLPSLPAGLAAQGHLDLTELIGVPLPSSVSFVTGYGGFPAYSFGPGANVGRPARTLIPSTFFRDFAISVRVKPSSPRGGALFAITDAFQKVIYLGLRLSGVEDGRQRVILYYTEPGAQVSREAAAFLVPVMTHRWSYFAVVVQGEEVTLLVDCEEHGRVPFPRSSQALTFEPSAGIFVGNAGATGLERFTVSPSLADEEAAGHCSKHMRLLLLSFYPYVLKEACMLVGRTLGSKLRTKILVLSFQCSLMILDSS